jgi:hypothetical protein
MSSETKTIMTKERYDQYIRDFNAACAGDGSAFSAFYDKYYEPDAIFEYIPTATKNIGKEVTVSFWMKVHDIMNEEIKDHRSFVLSDTTVAVEAPIDFLCKSDLEWVGVKHKAGSSFRLLMSAFYDISPTGKFSYVRVYSVYHPDYQLS